MTGLEAVLAVTALSCALWAVREMGYRKSETRRADSLFTLLEQTRQEAHEYVASYRETLAEERDRNEHLQRILDQYRAEGIQNPSYHDYGDPTPEKMQPLPREAETWLSGLDAEVRPEFEGLIRERLENEEVADILSDLSTVH